VALRIVPVKLTLCAPILRLKVLPVRVVILLRIPANKRLGLIAFSSVLASVSLSL
jgi:hypothetical protein